MIVAGTLTYRWPSAPSCLYDPDGPSRSYVLSMARARNCGGLFPAVLSVCKGVDKIIPVDGLRPGAVRRGLRR